MVDEKVIRDIISTKTHLERVVDSTDANQSSGRQVRVIGDRRAPPVSPREHKTHEERRHLS